MGIHLFLINPNYILDPSRLSLHLTINPKGMTTEVPGPHRGWSEHRAEHGHNKIGMMNHEIFAAWWASIPTPLKNMNVNWDDYSEKY